MLIWVHERINRLVRTRELAEAPHDGHQFGRFQKDEAPSAVVIRERTERFITQRNLLTQLPGRRRVKDSRRQRRHGLIHPTESVDGHLFDEQFLAFANLCHLFIRNECFYRHVPSQWLPLFCRVRCTRANTP